MAMAGIMILFVSLINVALPVALLCILQYFLSKMESPWPGRVLPMILYITIYRRTRRNLVVKKNMEKMSIQDLE